MKTMFICSLKGLSPALSPQPGPSRESTNPIASIPTNTPSPSKRKQRSPRYQVPFMHNNTDDAEDEVSFSMSNHSSREVHDDEDEEEDDITLQDLVAMETMDDADELDINSENSLRDEDELYEHAVGTGILRTEDSSVNASKAINGVNGTDGFSVRRFAGSNVGCHLITSPTNPLESYRNAMLHMSGKLHRFLFHSFKKLQID